MRENKIYIYIMISNISDLERGKNYMVEYRALGENPMNFIGKFRGIVNDIEFDFEIMYNCDYYWQFETFSEWKPWEKSNRKMTLYVKNFNKTFKIYSLGPSGQLITPTTPLNKVSEIAYLISGKDPKTQFSKLPQDLNDNIKSFLGGKRKSRRRSRKSRRSRRTRKYKRK
jgi:hypothetical protein